MEAFLKCDLCESRMTRAVTVIPCGHQFCHKCKSAGYLTTECSACLPRSKITAVYQNGMIEDFLKVFLAIEQVKKGITDVVALITAAAAASPQQTLISKDPAI